MHHEIGSELLRLVEVFSKREKELRVQLREMLSRWVREDFEDKIFLEQLHKNKTDELIDDYYDIENIVPEHSALWNGGPLAHYLRKYPARHAASRSSPSSSTNDSSSSRACSSTTARSRQN
jgi:hypothetical protein